MHLMTFVKGAALGAGAMYLFDPSRGRTRRARIRDKAVHMWNEAGDAVESKTRDLANRTQGIIHDAATVLSPDRARSSGSTSSSPWLPANWSPTTRLLVTAGAGLLALYGKHKGGTVGAALAAVSIGVVTNSVSSRELRHGIGATPSLPTDYDIIDDEAGLRSSAESAAHRPRSARRP